MSGTPVGGPQYNPRQRCNSILNTGSKGCPACLAAPWRPCTGNPLPIETLVKERIDAIIQESIDDVDTAIALCLYCMKTQIFNDGNKRASVIFANLYMISKGKGLIVIPESDVHQFKQLLVAYYEDRDHGEIIQFMRTKCWRPF